MSRQRKRRKPLNSASSSSSPPKHATPKHATHRDEDNIFATPKSHHINDDDSDSSPYSLSFSQRCGVEVTWGERAKSTSFKSKTYEQRDTESPPTKVFVDEPASESPKGLFKFLLGWERRGLSTQIENDFQSISDETTGTFNGIVNSVDSHSSTTNDTTFFTAKEKVEETKSKIGSSTNFKQLLNDSEDMDLIMCSQRIEQEVCKSKKPVIAIASKGFSAAFSDDDDDLLLANLDDPTLVDKKLPQKSVFARHKSIAIQPNSSITAGTTASKHNSSSSNKHLETKTGSAIQPVKKIESPTASSISTTPSKPILVRHKSMPSPNLAILQSMKKCTAEEIEIKRRNALAKLKLRKQRLTKQ